MDVNNVTAEVYTADGDIAAGILYVFFSFLLLTAGVLIFWVLMSSVHLCHRWTYQILLHIFAINILQLLIHLLSGIMNISQSNFHYWLDKTAGAVLTTSASVEVLLLFVFAINRLQVITNGPLFYYVSDAFVYKLMLSLSYIIGLFFFVSHMTPFTGFSFSRQCNCWVYSEGPFTSVVRAADKFVSLTVCVFTFSMYFYTFAYCFKHRILTSRLCGEQRNERNLLVVAGLMFLYGLALVVIHCFAGVGPDNGAEFVVFDMFWITYAGSFQIFHFAFNSEMVATARHMFCSPKIQPVLKKRVAEQTVTVVV
uniref:G_PROTEIN_RECEP_F1_2 domain-containing protein n=1 Tax=Steinernema glaseri TaxID=37863 RepID=A0A1I8AUW1_9BILA